MSSHWVNIKQIIAGKELGRSVESTGRKKQRWLMAIVAPPPKARIRGEVGGAHHKPA